MRKGEHLIFKKIFSNSFLEREKKKERKTSMLERNINGLPLAHPLSDIESTTQTRARILNWQHFGAKGDAQLNEHYHQGREASILIKSI